MLPNSVESILNEMVFLTAALRRPNLTHRGCRSDRRGHHSRIG